MEVDNYLKNDSLLIVGGTGFIGSNVAQEAVNRGFKVSVICRNNSLSSKKLEKVHYIKVDISNENSLRLKLKNKNFDYVINLSGYVDHDSYFGTGNKVIETHFQGVRNLVNAFQNKKIKSFIHLGSSDEYGLNPAPQNEKQREFPISPYAFAKVASSHFLQMLYRIENFPAVILRPFLVYGPGQNNQRFLPQVIQGCMKNSPFPVSKGEQLRDFCYITDIVDAIFFSIGNKKVYGEVINIASGRSVPIKEVVFMVRDLIGKGEPVFGEIEYRKNENMHLYADISKAKKLLKWSPKIDFENGLAMTISSTLEQKK